LINEPDLSTTTALLWVVGAVAVLLIASWISYSTGVAEGRAAGYKLGRARGRREGYEQGVADEAARCAYATADRHPSRFEDLVQKHENAVVYAFPRATADAE
jgi:hypothetical protein